MAPATRLTSTNTNNNSNNNSANVMSDSSNPLSSGGGDIFSTATVRDAGRLGLDGQVWGNQSLGSSGGGVVVFSTKLASHKYCLDSLKLTAMQQSAT